MMESKKVFISYSWSVQERVIELAERLLANGIDVVLDVYDLKEGQDKYAFMEQSVNDPSIDRVLIICDKAYTEKANSRSGGVGDETVIISPEIYNQVKQEKFIPIIFEVDDEGKAYCPAYIKSRIYIDLSTEDDGYEIEYEKLLRNIFEKPMYKKPALGVQPAWLENDIVDLSQIRDLIKQVRGYTGGNIDKADFLLRKAADQFLITAQQYTLPENKPLDEGLIIVIDQYKSYRDLFIDYLESIIYSGLPLYETVTSLIEKLYNGLHVASGKGSYCDSDFEVYDFLIWELFISTTAICLHYEKYSELYRILSHTYFLKESYFSNSLKSYNYTNFRAYCETVETKCKEKCGKPNLYTLMGDILVKREKKPILTKESLSNADLVLYQLFPLLDLDSDGQDYWFPLTYVYHRETQNIWRRMKSKRYCEKIKVLFGAKTIEDLKIKVSKSVTNRDMKYSRCFDTPLAIISSIRLEDIATLN